MERSDVLASFRDTVIDVQRSLGLHKLGRSVTGHTVKRPVKFVSRVKDSLPKFPEKFIPKAILLSTALFAGSALLASCGGKSSKNTEQIQQKEKVVTVSQALNNCDTFENANSAKKYNLDSVAPTFKEATGSKIENLNKDTAPDYVYSLFGENGPLAAKGDIHTLAFFQSIITIPAQKGILSANGRLTNYNYLETYSQVLNHFKGDPASTEEACKNTFKTMIETGAYTNNFAQNGEEVILFIPIRNNNGDVVSYQAKKVIVGSNQVLLGVEFNPNNNHNTRNYAGFPSVLLTPEGQVYLKGVNLVNVNAPQSKKNLSSGVVLTENSNKTIAAKVIETPNSKNVVSSAPAPVTTPTTEGTGTGTSTKTTIGETPTPAPTIHKTVGKGIGTTEGTGTSGTGTEGTGTGTEGTGTSGTITGQPVPKKQPTPTPPPEQPVQPTPTPPPEQPVQPTPTPPPKQPEPVKPPVDCNPNINDCTPSSSSSNQSQSSSYSSSSESNVYYDTSSMYFN